VRSIPSKNGGNPLKEKGITRPAWSQNHEGRPRRKWKRNDLFDDDQNHLTFFLLKGGKNRASEKEKSQKKALKKVSPIAGKNSRKGKWKHFYSQLLACSHGDGPCVRTKEGLGGGRITRVGQKGSIPPDTGLPEPSVSSTIRALKHQKRDREVPKSRLRTKVSEAERQPKTRGDVHLAQTEKPDQPHRTGKNRTRKGRGDGEACG